MQKFTSLHFKYIYNTLLYLSQDSKVLKVIKSTKLIIFHVIYITTLITLLKEYSFCVDQFVISLNRDQ